MVWECEDCETRFVVEALGPTSAADRFFESLGGTLPSVIAVPILSYHQEKNPVLRLHRLCDAVEMLTRFAAVVMMSPFRRDDGEVQFSIGLANFLRSSIRRPTLGVWARILESLVKEVRKKQLTPFTGTMSDFAASLLLPALFGSASNLKLDKSGFPGEAGDLSREQSFIELRNALVHGGAMTNLVAAKYLEVWEARLDELWQASAFLTKTDLVYVQENVILKLYGNARALVYEPNKALRAILFPLANRVALISEGTVVDLFPLCGYEVDDQANLPNQETSGNPTLYYRAESEKLLYSVFGGTQPIFRTRNAMVEFVRMFDLGTGERSGRVASRDFENDAIADASMLIGRRSEIEEVKRAFNKQSHGVLWISGAAGIGKSFVSAKLAVDLNGNPKETLRLFWRFQSGDPRSAAEPFLVYAVTRLAKWLGQQDLIRDSQNRLELENRLRELLGFVSQDETTTPNGKPKRVLIILDGIDEITRIDAEFTKIPFEMDFTNVVWICVGREEGKLARYFSPENCVHVFADGLPPLSSENIRAMLLEQPGETKYGLLKRDVELTGGVSEEARNPFVESVVFNAKGLPLYVRFVIDDLLRGVYDFNDEKKLPAGLADYYQRILSQLSIGDLQSVLTPIMMLLALAGSPLDRECIYDLMAGMQRIVPGSEGRTLLDRAIEHSQALVRRDPTAWGSEGFRLCHETLREYLLISSDTSQQRLLMYDGLARLVVQWQQIPAGIGLNYLFSFGAAHLAQAKQWARLLALFEVPEFSEGCVRFLRQELSSEPDKPDAIAPLLDEAVRTRSHSIVRHLLPEIQWASFRGHYANAQRHLPRLEELCQISPQDNLSNLTLLDYLHAWLEREMGNIVRAVNLFSKINIDNAGEHRERILFQQANAMRESGDFEAARPIYRQLYLENRDKKLTTSDYLIFAQQYADIEYVQGQNVLALNILGEIERTSSKIENPMEVAEILRIQGHIYRISEELEEAAKLYYGAKKLFAESHSIYGIARIETNLAETFAFVSPLKAMDHARRAIRLNTNLGTMLEVGKARNALGLAHLAIGELDQSEKELGTALLIQEQVGYRAGQGWVRLSLLLHSLFAGDDAERSNANFMEMFELFESLNAYPLLIYKAAVLTRNLGRPTEEILEIQRRYRGQIQWPESVKKFEQLVSEHYQRS